MISPGVIRIRKSLCRDRCKADPNDPCAFCENGHWGRYEETGCDDGAAKIGLGDKIERAINKIPGASLLPCHDKTTGQLKPESGCGKMKKRLNEGMPIGEAIKLRLKGE